jgi:hypothetical protein
VALAAGSVELPVRPTGSPGGSLTACLLPEGARWTDPVMNPSRLRVNPFFGPCRRPPELFDVESELLMWSRNFDVEPEL